MAKNERLPIIIGKNLRKGVMAFQDKKSGGYNFMIVWLKRDIPTGETFETEDIDKVNAVLHFCDRETLQNTVNLMNTVLKETEGENDL